MCYLLRHIDSSNSLRVNRAKCHTFDKLECLISCLLGVPGDSTSYAIYAMQNIVYCFSASIHSSSPVPARRGRSGLHDQGLRRASEERGMPGALQRRLQERGEEGTPGSGGPQDGGKGPKWVRERVGSSV